MIPPVSGRTTITSAPGKVLLAGGYLVLDRLYTGLVVATSSRFYCCITDIPSSSASSCHGDTAGISVRAGQFPEDASTWSYTLTRKHGSELSLEPLDPSTGRNKFVEISLAKTLEYALETLSAECSAEEAGTALLRRVRGDGAGMDIVVLADNDFYSQREQVSRSFPTATSWLIGFSARRSWPTSSHLLTRLPSPFLSPSSATTPNQQNWPWVLRRPRHIPHLRSSRPS